MIFAALAVGVVFLASVVVVAVGRSRRRDQNLGSVSLTDERRTWLNDAQHRQRQDRGD